MQQQLFLFKNKFSPGRSLKQGVSILIDAEESWIQTALDKLIKILMGVLIKKK